MEKTQKKGLTLVELLVSMGIVAYMLTVLYFCFIQGINVYKTSGETVPSFREGSIALQQMCRDLQIGSYELIYPGLYDLAQEDSYGIVFARYDFMTKEKEIIGYFLDESNRNIKRTLYNPAFTSLDPFQLEPLKDPSNPRKVGTAKALHFRIEDDGLLSISISLKDKTPTLKTKIRCGFIREEVFR